MSRAPPLDDSSAADPRPRPGVAAPPLDSSGALRPAVATASPRGGPGLLVAGAAGLGILVFILLSSQRHAPDKTEALAGGPTVNVPPPPPSDILMTEAAGRGAPLAAATPAVVMAEPPPTTLGAPPSQTILRPISFASDTAALGRKTPTVIVDLGEAAAQPASGASLSVASGATKTAAGAADSAGLNADEKFAERVAAVEPERSRATVIRNTRETIPQGVMIPGVLETALNSDLPGFTRAVISRDVRGFDGSTVLIPRGSRVIGQYKSAAAQGQSRAFVIWTRIIRPDGASIQIASSGTDALGRAGLDGKVDRHFFEQYAGAILLTVLDAAVASVAGQPSTQVVIGSSTGGLAPAAPGLTATPIPPTIKVPQGSPIRIFVARDLDFSPVGAAR